MARIPNADQAVILAAKLRYLLDADHPQNGGKAGFFARHGFRLDAPEALAAALRRHALGEATVILAGDDVKYRLVGPMQAPDGRRPWVLSVWMIGSGEIAPRFITARPRRRRT